jgi:hypothetical protein
MTMRRKNPAKSRDSGYYLLRLLLGSRSRFDDDPRWGNGAAVGAERRVGSGLVPTWESGIVELRGSNGDGPAAA